MYRTFLNRSDGRNTDSLLQHLLPTGNPSPPGSSLYGFKAVSRLAVATLVVILTTALASKIFALDLVETNASSWETLKGKITGSCPQEEPPAVPYPDTIFRTALATYPRSGSSFTRNLVEKATGFQTSSIYCDKRLSHFEAECMGLDSPFLIKTHWPYKDSRDIDAHKPHWTHFSKAVRVVRNPFDALWSHFHFARSGNHSARVDGVEKLSLSVDLHRTFLEGHVKEWVKHARYWREEVDIPVHVVRYEDLRSNGQDTLKDLLDFFVPSAHRPSSLRIACATADDPSKDPYFSRKSAPFSAWHHYDEETRLWILDQTRDEWCRRDFNILFKEALSLPAPIDCSTMSVIP